MCDIPPLPIRLHGVYRDNFTSFVKFCVHDLQPERLDVITSGVPFNFGVELTVLQLPRFRNRSQVVSSPYKRDS